MRKLPELALATLVAFAAGCGSGSDSGNAAAPTPVTQADIAKIPPAAQQHASEMNDYTKAMNAAMANKAKTR